MAYNKIPVSSVFNDTERTVQNGCRDLSVGLIIPRG